MTAEELLQMLKEKQLQDEAIVNLLQEALKMVEQPCEDCEKASKLLGVELE